MLVSIVHFLRTLVRATWPFSPCISILCAQLPQCRVARNHSKPLPKVPPLRCHTPLLRVRGHWLVRGGYRPAMAHWPTYSGASHRRGESAIHSPLGVLHCTMISEANCRARGLFPTGGGHRSGRPGDLFVTYLPGTPTQTPLLLKPSRFTFDSIWTVFPTSYGVYAWKVTFSESNECLHSTGSLFEIWSSVRCR